MCVPLLFICEFDSVGFVFLTLYISLQLAEASIHYLKDENLTSPYVFQMFECDDNVYLYADDRLCKKLIKFHISACQGASVLADLGTEQVEFIALSQRTGIPKYKEKVDYYFVSF